MTAISTPISTVSPSCALSSDSTPACGALTSMVAFSVSSSTIGSSRATVSPAFLSHWPMVASVTDSPKDGTVTSTDAPSPADAAALAGAGAGLDTGAAAFVPDAAPSAITPKRAFTSTVSPSLAATVSRTPSVGALTSNVTLSVSSSTIGSSRLTGSPGFLSHWATIASVTDSPRAGTLISTIVEDLFVGSTACGVREGEPVNPAG